MVGASTANPGGTFDQGKTTKGKQMSETSSNKKTVDFSVDDVNAVISALAFKNDAFSKYQSHFNPNSPQWHFWGGEVAKINQLLNKIIDAGSAA
ncbi:MAG: hypothetical protein ACXWJD_12670 [Burkholderiaceae bacterium]